MRIVSLGNYYNYSDKRLIPKALWEFALSQRANGFVNAVYPSASDLIIPDCSAQWISTAWEYYFYSGDLNFLKKLYPFLKKQMEGFIKDSDKDSLLRWQTGWWIFIDQGDQELNNDKSISLNLFYLETLKSMSKIAKAVGEAEEEKKFNALAEKVKDSINQIAWNAQKHLYVDCLMDGNPCRSFSRQTNSLALSQGIIPPKEINSVVGSLLSDSNLPLIITPYFNSFVAESFFKNGFDREAINLIKSYWGGMIKHGATTFWESYDSQKGRESASFGESLAHGWSSGPAYLLPKWLLGIVPLEPGFTQFQIKPVFTGLSFVSGKIPVGDGTIEVSWEKKTQIKLSLNYDFPAKAVIILPRTPGDSLFVNEKRVPAIISGGTISYLIETPGKYRLELK